jgi:hypothetical protein
LGARVGFLACLATLMLALGATAAVAPTHHPIHHHSTASIHTHHKAKTGHLTHHQASASHHTTTHKHGARHPQTKHSRGSQGAVSSKHRHAKVAHHAPARRHAQLCQQVMMHGHWVSHCR